MYKILKSLEWGCSVGFYFLGFFCRFFVLFCFLNIFWSFFTAVLYRCHFEPQLSMILSSPLKKSLWKFNSSNSVIIHTIFQSSLVFEVWFSFKLVNIYKVIKISFHYIYRDTYLHHIMQLAAILGFFSTFHLGLWFWKFNSVLCKKILDWVMKLAVELFSGKGESNFWPWPHKEFVN